MCIAPYTTKTTKAVFRGLKLRKTGLLGYKYREIFVLVLDVICTLLSEV